MAALPVPGAETLISSALGRILPGGGSSRSSSQSASSSNVSVANTVNPVIALSSPGTQSGGSSSASGSSGTGQQSASLPDYLPGRAPTYTNAPGINPSLRQDPRYGVEYAGAANSNSSIWLLLAAGAAAILLISGMGKGK